MVQWKRGGADGAVVDQSVRGQHGDAGDVPAEKADRRRQTGIRSSRLRYVPYLRLESTDFD